MADKLWEIEKNKNAIIEDFIANGKISTFNKLMHFDTRPKVKKEYKVEKLSDFYRRMKVQMSKERHLLAIDIYENRGNSQINRYDLSRFQLPDDSDKNMLKGNYKWASQKFKQMKYNLAKRKGIPYSQFEMPKFVRYPKKTRNSSNVQIATTVTEQNLDLPQLRLPLKTKI